MQFTINGANVVHANPHVIDLNVTEQRNLTYPKFRFKAAPTGEDSGLFEAKLFASDNTYGGGNVNDRTSK